MEMGYLADYHTHTCCSPDSDAPLTEMAAAAERMGLGELCTTDHCDLLGLEGERLEQWSWAGILGQYRAAAESSGIKVTLGLELGGAPEDRLMARAILSQAAPDFVIGSIHNQSRVVGGRDFYVLDYPDEAACRWIMKSYFNSLTDLANMPDCYDVIGHITYPLRYMNGRGGQKIALTDFREQLEALLRLVVEWGRGIEVNTNRGREVEAWREILALYRSVGGEIVTIGSDAHRPEDVGLGIAEAAALLRESGFRYWTAFTKREPRFVAL